MQRVQLLLDLETRGGWIVFVVLVVVYVLITVFLPFPDGMAVTNGDEPHYLLSAHSLYYDGDFDLLNNYENGDYRSFYDAGHLEPHVLGYKGRTLPLHPLLGVPLAILPAYVLGGRIGVLVFLNALVAIGVASTYRISQVYASSKVSFWVALFLGLTYPVIVYSHQIYSETIAFVVVACTLAQIVSLNEANYRAKALVIGSLLGALLHFHLKFVVLVCTLFAFYVCKSRAYWFSALKWSAVPFVLFVIALGTWIYVAFGEISFDVLQASATKGMSGGLSGVLGLVFDQECGLLFFSPLYLMGFVGLWMLWRDEGTRHDAFFMTLVYAGHHLTVGTFWDWIGGLSPVPRYLIPILPVLGVAVAKAIDGYWRQRRVLQPTLLALASVLVTGLILYERRFTFGFGVGSNVFLRQLLHVNEPMSTMLINLLPSFWTTRGLKVYARLAFVLAALYLFWFLSDRVNRLLLAWQKKLVLRQGRSDR